MATYITAGITIGYLLFTPTNAELPVGIVRLMYSHVCQVLVYPRFGSPHFFLLMCLVIYWGIPEGEASILCAILTCISMVLSIYATATHVPSDPVLVLDVITILAGTFAPYNEIIQTRASTGDDT